MQKVEKSNKKQLALLFFIGFAGILSIVPIIPQLLSDLPKELPFSMQIMQLIAVLQSSLLLIAMLVLGSYFSKRVKLTAPVTLAITDPKNILPYLKPQIMPAVIGGIIGGIFILVFSTGISPYLPEEFLEAGEKFIPPWYTRLLYGGITEEILIRWGLMSFFVWVSYRITQKIDGEIKSHNYFFAIVLSALLFGLLHLPAVNTLTNELTPTLVLYTLVGNGAFGLIAGYLFWKRGLECAIGAHMIAHVLIILAGMNF